MSNDDQTPRRIDPLAPGRIYLAPIDTAMPVSAEDLAGFTPFGFASDSVSFDMEGLDDGEPLATEFPGGTFTTTIQGGNLWDALAEAMPEINDPHAGHGHIEGPWTCPVCGERITMQGRIDEWTEEPFRIHAVLENDEELRAHVRTHGIDGADDVPLEITVGKR